MQVNGAKASVATVNTNVVLVLQEANFQLVRCLFRGSFIHSKGHIITTSTSPMIPTNRVIARFYVNEIINVRLGRKSEE